MPHSTTPTTKVCTKCGETKPLDEYYRNHQSPRPDAYISICKSCKSKQARAWYEANRERAAETTRVWREANAERRAETTRLWREANAERRAKQARAWSAANRERLKEFRAANRERQLEIKRAWRIANPEKQAENGRRGAARYRARYPQRVAARVAVGGAVRRGKMPRPSDLPCVTCGKPADHYHHHNGYEREHRFDVIAVCIDCHLELHKEES